jgi:hypothetical protein
MGIVELAQTMTKPNQKKNMKQVNEACNQQAMEASERAKRLAMTNTA